MNQRHVQLPLLAADERTLDDEARAVGDAIAHHGHVTPAQAGRIALTIRGHRPSGCDSSPALLSAGYRTLRRLERLGHARQLDHRRWGRP